MPLIPLGATLLRFARAVWATLKDPESRDLVVFTVLILGILLSFVNLVATHARKPIIPRRGKKDQAEPTPPADESADTAT